VENPDGWARVAKAVLNRRTELGITVAEAVRRSGDTVSAAVWSILENARQDSYRPRTLAGVCRALGWTANSIDQILAGGQPTSAGAQRAPTGEPTVDRLLDAVSELTDDEREQLIAIAETFRRKRT
jgi:hypothetical protein